jgi:hypothetical protein
LPEPYDQLRRLPVLYVRERGIAGVTRVVLDTDGVRIFGVRMEGDILMAHALDDGSVPPDDVVRRLLPPFAIDEFLGTGKDVPGGLPGVHRPPISDVKDDRVNLPGSLDGVSISVGGNPNHIRKPITRHETLLIGLRKDYLERS